jgi:hypothetical protein
MRSRYSTILADLKKVISPQALDIRSKQQMETPSMFRKNKKGRIPWSLSSKNTAKQVTPKT